MAPKPHNGEINGLSIAIRNEDERSEELSPSRWHDGKVPLSGFSEGLMRQDLPWHKKPSVSNRLPFKVSKC
jgi:hypothetical protein